MTMTKICVWPDDNWCLEEDVELELNYRSDDYQVIEISDDWDYDKIEEFVHRLNRGEL